MPCRRCGRESSVQELGSIVDWYGPFTQQNGRSAISVANSAAQEHFTSGLYAAIGSGRSERRGPKSLLYMGVGSPLYTRINHQHHVLSKVVVSEIWLGEVASAGVPGRRAKKIDPHLDLIEWASVFFLSLPENERKNVTPPPSSCVILNRWWSPGADWDRPTKRPVRRWADVIEWNDYTGSANLVWFGRLGRMTALNRNRNIMARTG
jgi:hypothetical protein